MQAAADPGSQERCATVLLVEDEGLLRAAVADYLGGCGFRVLEAETAAEAKAHFTDGSSINLVFTDVQLPGNEDGFSLVRWVEQHHPRVRTIIASGAPEVARPSQDFALTRPFLRKPYSFGVLLFHIRRLITP